jgi:hypothetical protein
MQTKTTTKSPTGDAETFDIATGRSRRELNWKNDKMTWPDLVKRLAHTHRTHESFNEYVAAKKPRQDELKDRGGFVGGYLQGGHRKIASVMHRQLITLDLDFATQYFWDDLQMLTAYSGESDPPFRSK